jgi:hypothetical protein
MPIHLGRVYACFHLAPADLNGWNRDYMACEAKKKKNCSGITQKEFANPRGLKWLEEYTHKNQTR